MRRVALYIVVILVAMLQACGTAPKGNGKILFVSIDPLRFITQQIVGEEWSVQTFVPKGSSPETYDPTPSQLVEVSQSKAFFMAGYLSYEVQWGERLKENAPNVEFCNTAQGIDLLTSKHYHGKEEHQGVDPHTWTSPRNMMQIAKNVCLVLSRIDASNKEQYLQNLDKLNTRLAKVDSTLTEELQNCKQKTFAIYHPSLTYFANDYGLRQLCIEDEGKEPSPQQLQQLIEQCRAQGVKTIFIQKEFNVQNAQVIAQEIGAQLVQIDPLNYDWEEEMLKIARYLSNETTN